MNSKIDSAISTVINKYSRVRRTIKSKEDTELETAVNDLARTVKEVRKNYEHIHAIVAIGTVWYEDFVDEDTGDVVTVERFNKKSTHIVRISLPRRGRTNANRMNTLDSYLRLYPKEIIRIIKPISECKYFDIKQGLIKAHLGITPITI